MASLSASLAAVSLAVFLVLPTFRGLIEREQHPGYSEYEKLKRLFRGFTSLGIASILFSIGTALGVIGQHWSCKALLLCQQLACVIGLILSALAIVTVWRTVASSLK